MPYQISDQTCMVCGTSNTLFRTKWHSQNNKYYLQKVCKPCERDRLYQWRKDNPEKLFEHLHKSYMKTSEGKVSRRNNMNHTEESKKQWSRDKSNKRCSRAKQARFDDELTQFVTTEAHELRKLRNNITGVEWHVDHIIPLRGKEANGLHIWSNLRVIPKKLNLIKGAKIALHETRPKNWEIC